jgi:hypothetical protein
VVNEYIPDTWFPECWVVLRIVSIKDNNQVFYRLLSGWYGGYLHGDSWRLNSGITEVKDGGDYWTVFGRLCINRRLIVSSKVVVAQSAQQGKFLKNG